MNILIFSDLHGSYDTLKLLKDKFFTLADEIWCLGDIFYNYKRDAVATENAKALISNLNTYIEKKILYIQGNCDGYKEYEDFQDHFNKEPYVLKEINGLKLILSHGHLQETDEHKITLLTELDAKVIISGHTHIYSMDIKSGFAFINPGSPSVPRDANSIGTFIIFNTDKKKFTLHEINTGDVLQELYLIK
ncbi:MAG: hypothetical protein A2Y40_10015 [Candidatus Margulisbacteria bacterium GWF2_35_9]|nr:MAG: hypothetical protein A2Y40_10015 [Candidatus Margulisbacteria bacterium GWF2_35_9]